jgi:ATP-dependent exoDNAse (exonuclease V) alpha subunit
VLVDLLVDEVLDRRSVALVAPRDGIDEPQGLRRTDGSSVYTVAGADLYTSQRILDAEQRLVTTAGRHDGTVVDKSAVNLALLELAANGAALDAGQASLVQHMCTSGNRLQLAIAPAGAGKTTAMRALTLAWTQDGGQMLGLAPSAAAAAVLAEQTGIHADTRQTHLVLAARRPARLGGRGRTVNLGDHRRSRHGRHPHPRRGRAVRHRSRCQCPANR